MKMIIPLIFMTMMKLNYKSIINIMMILMTMSLIFIPPFNKSISLNNLFFMDLLSFSLFSLSLMSFTLIIISSFNMKKIFTLMIFISSILAISFLASNMIMFYIFFEAVLIPTILLITMDGNSPERLQAGMYLLMYTIFGSLPLLLGLLFLSESSSFLYLYSNTYTFEFPLIFILAFLIKLPMFFFHLWLPKAHVEAPLEGSMILAAVLLKLGGYGLIRLLPAISNMSSLLKSSFISISLMGATMTSLNCLRQKDMKALIAYSSVSHMGLVLASLMTFKFLGLFSAILLMIAHGLTSSALFFLITISYSHTHTRNILMLKGLLIIMPNLTMWWFTFSVLNMSVPPSINMISEVLIFSSLCQNDTMNSLMIFMMSMSTAAFCIFFYSVISHNNNPLYPMSNNPNKKIFLSLFSHSYPIILISTKTELFSNFSFMKSSKH